MGPRSHERGNVDIAKAESARLLRASMGPRSHERGNEALNRRVNVERIASMGPRSHERGNAIR